MMEAVEEAVDKSPGQILHDAVWFLLHTTISVVVLFLMVGAITLAGAQSFPMALAALLAFVVPGLAGFLIAKLRNDVVARYIWISGLIWFSIICVWVLDMPTGPGLCEKCGASDKLYLTFFTLTQDSGLIAGMGRLVGTWPALAMVGYAIGARFGLTPRQAEEDS